MSKRGSSLAIADARDIHTLLKERLGNADLIQSVAEVCISFKSCALQFTTN